MHNCKLGPVTEDLQRREIRQQRPGIGERNAPDEDLEQGGEIRAAQRIFYAGWRG